LPLRSSLIGASISAILASIPFLWILPPGKTAGLVLLGMISQIGLALFIAFLWLMLKFWRDPERVPIETEGVVLSPADGVVKYINRIDQGLIPSVIKNGRSYSVRELAGTDILAACVYVIGVEMNLLNVHVNRCPISGQVRQVSHIPGKFLSLRREEAPYVNERCTTLIENQRFRVAAVQIASRLVRQIDNYLHSGETVSAGQRLGMIRFGSLVAVILPNRTDVKLHVNVGDHLEAGVSILARYG
jgi:phosphatidylserine decarboxylase